MQQKLKLPKQVTFVGKTWTIETSKDESGAFYNGNTATIGIGTKQPQTILNSFVHEVFEATMDEMFVKFRNCHTTGENGDVMFAFNHRDLDIIIGQVSLAIEALINRNSKTAHCR